MIKWLCEIVYAFHMKKAMRISFWQALRFVRCDYLCQQDIRKFIGLDEDNPKGG